MKDQLVYVMRLGLRMLGLALPVVHLSGCEPFCASIAARRSLKGIVRRADTLEVPTDVVLIGAFTSTDGELTGSGGGGRTVQPSSEDGSFQLRLRSSETKSVCGQASPSSLPAFPAPDEILVIVQREACEQQFTIEINEDTVVDLGFPDNVIELKDPILVPPCGAEESGQ